MYYVCDNEVEIWTDSGEKGEDDFLVRYKEPGGRRRTPKHVHLVTDLIEKRGVYEELTNQLIEALLETAFDISSSSSEPELQFYSGFEHEEYSELDDCGDYSVEFLMVVMELIAIQEKNNYPDGTLNVELLQAFLDGADNFTLFSKATWRGPRGG